MTNAAIGDPLLRVLCRELLALCLPLTDVPPLDLVRLPFDGTIGLHLLPPLHHFPTGIALHSMRALNLPFAMGPLDADLTLRTFDAHPAFLPLHSNLALRALGPDTLNALGMHLTLGPFGPLAAASLFLHMFRSAALAAVFVRFRRCRRRQRKGGATGNPYHFGHD